MTPSIASFKEEFSSRIPALTLLSGLGYTLIPLGECMVLRGNITHWDNLNTLFIYPEKIRKVIYITNAIESLNSVLRKARELSKV